MDLTDALAFARDSKQGVLATIRANGRPQLSNIMFVPGDGHTLLISVTDDRAKTVNLRRDPRASLYVLGHTFWQYVVIEATAELSPVAADPHDATVDALIAYYPRGRASTPTGRTIEPPWCRTVGSCSRCGPNGPTASSRRAERQPAGWGSGSLAAAPAPSPSAWPNDSSTNWERSSTRTSSSLLKARTASSSMIMQ